MPDSPLPRRLFDHLIDASTGMVFNQRTATEIPSLPGAYILAIELTKPASIPARFRQPALPPGWYLYCGSARGPGGLRARLSRHMRADKKIRWHVDHLTVAARSIHAVISHTRSECDLQAGIAARSGFFAPVPGFGSSDCKECISHLLAWRSV